MREGQVSHVRSAGAFVVIFGWVGKVIGGFLGQELYSALYVYTIFCLSVHQLVNIRLFLHFGYEYFAVNSCV